MQNQFCLSDAAKLSCENVFIRSVTLIPCGDSLNTLDVYSWGTLLVLALLQVLANKLYKTYREKIFNTSYVTFLFFMIFLYHERRKKV